MTWGSLMQPLSAQQQAEVIARAVDSLQGLPLTVIRDQQQLTSHARTAVANVLSRLSLSASADVQAEMIQQVVARMGGLGFLTSLLPPARNDLSEITVNPDGSVWVLPKGARYFEQLDDLHPPLEEVWRAVEALLAPIGRAISEATPSVDAKLPRAEGTGGARVKILHPALVPGKGYPSINVRLFEAKPVLPEKVIAWGVAPQAVIQSLLDAIAHEARLLIVGGTGTGKTTLLSALCNGIPKGARVVKIEDPEEIWIDHPHVVTIEARPAAPGSTVPAYALRNGVDDAMRMSPQYLIVGEVRTGDAAMSLFRALMSDHPGLSTFHAEGPEKAVGRMVNMMGTDAEVKVAEAAKGTFAMAIDLLVQIGWLDDRRQILGVWEVEEELRGGNVKFRQLYKPGDTAMGEIKRRH